MARTDWRIKAIEFAACNCNWGCPCQFNTLPSLGHCTGGMAMTIDEGYFGSTRLEGVTWGMIGEWPGAIHEGNGRLQVFVDERASAAQRQAMVEIVHGKHSAEGTFFNIFSAVCPTKLEPVFSPVTLTMNPADRTAHLSVPGVFEISGEPIRNPVTGEASFSRVVLPQGFEFKEADFASCQFSATGAIKVERKDGHAHFAQLHWGPDGYID